MTAGPWVPTTGFVTLMDGAGITGAEPWKIALFESTSNLSVSSTTFAGVTDEVPAGNGYVAGGLDVSLDVTASGITLSEVPEFVVESGEFVVRGSITARWACLYESAADVAAFYLLDDTPADVTVHATDTLRIDTGAVFTLV